MRTIAQIIYSIEEMENNLTDYPEEYSYDQHMLPLKLELASATMQTYFSLDGMSVGDAENTLWNAFGLGEDY